MAIQGGMYPDVIQSEKSEIAGMQVDWSQYNPCQNETLIADYSRHCEAGRPPVNIPRVDESGQPAKTQPSALSQINPATLFVLLIVAVILLYFLMK